MWTALGRASRQLTQHTHKSERVVNQREQTPIRSDPLFTFDLLIKAGTNSETTTRGAKDFGDVPGQSPSVFCVSVCQSICVPVCESVSLSLCPSACLSVCVSACRLVNTGPD